VIVKARIGTSDPEKATALRNGGVPDALVKPFHTADGFRALKELEEWKWTEAHYAVLCDFVHPNLSSQNVSTSSARLSRVAVSSGGGAMIMKESGPVVRYEYPSHIQSEFALQITEHWC